MITDTLQNELRERYNPDGSILRKQQLRMLEMLQYIDFVCKKHNIRYWLCSGTLLGAVRHGGFIPWDDDVDIEMLREDYKRLVRILKKDSDSRYALQTHSTDANYLYPYAKFRDLHSTLKEGHSMDESYRYHGIFIDIFVMEPSSSLILCKCSGQIYQKMLYALSRHIKNERVRKLYSKTVYSLLNYVLFPIIHFFSDWKSNGQLRHALGGLFLKPRMLKEIFPLTSIQFENVYFPIPHDSDSYLRRIYGNYMQLPDLDKINTHTIEIEIY